MKPKPHFTTKAEMRKTVKMATKALSEQQLAQKSAKLCEALTACIEAQSPSVLALFSPLSDEVDITSLMNRFSCRIVLPRVAVEGAEMDFYDYVPDQMASGTYGIIEPQGGEPCRVGDIDVMVVPGVAFTNDGARLGRGKGYYDRYMSQPDFRAYTIGVCFAHQIYDELPVEPHDCRIDRVICG